jgi:hypothetical protein
VAIVAAGRLTLPVYTVVPLVKVADGELLNKMRNGSQPESTEALFPKVISTPI